MKQFIAAIAALSLGSACGKGAAPTAPTPTATTAPPPAAPAPAPPSTPAPPVASSFVIDLPIAVGDAATAFSGINPFGVHLADHGVDGHPGWDFQYRIGATVRAAADGVIQTVTVPEPQRPTRYVVQLMHDAGGRTYRTVYFGIESPPADIAVGATVRRGAPLGPAAVISQVIGTTLQTYAMIHFQVDDFSYSGGLTNRNAVNPELFLSAGASAFFATLWNDASYSGELTEPFPSNPRDAAFPMTRRWTRQRGDLAEVVELTRPTGITNDYNYRLLDDSGRVLETGVARSSPSVRPFPTIDLIPASGATRLGVYDIVSNTMRLVMAPAGAPRPAGFTNETVYSTPGSSSMSRGHAWSRYWPAAARATSFSATAMRPARSCGSVILLRPATSASCSSRHVQAPAPA